MNTEKRLFDFAAWVLAVTALLVILTSCNPYAGLTTPSPAAATATGTANELQDATRTPTPAARTCRVTTGVPAGNLNIRTGPGTSYAVIGILREGQTLTLTDEPARDGWMQVTAGTVTGWINKTYCKEKESETE